MTGDRSAQIDIDSRVRMAACRAAPPALLASLAFDAEVMVRATVALNPASPPSADNRLVTDPDERVRMLLARKLAVALPSLSATDETELRNRLLLLLADLVRDETARVRAVISECLASVSFVPHDLILLLAQDRAVAVSEPILRLSPLLSPDDLLALLVAPPHAQTATAIACRINLPEDVSDAIVATSNSPAVCALLSNQSAAIREGTLDLLIARAAHQPEWHVPLSRRPRLAGAAAHALSEIVSAQLMAELADRLDLPAGVTAAIREKLAASQIRPPQTPDVEENHALLTEARRLADRQDLTERRLLVALRVGDYRRATAMLAVAADVTLEMVDRAALLRSAKGLVSLVCKAGFTAHAAAAVQLALGQIAPADVLVWPVDLATPLAAAEIAWQLSFLADGSH